MLRGLEGGESPALLARQQSVGSGEPTSWKILSGLGGELHFRHDCSDVGPWAWGRLLGDGGTWEAELGGEGLHKRP